MDTNRRRKIIRFDQLTPLGRAVWLAGAAVHLGARAVSASVRQVERIATQSKRSFREGLHGRLPANPPEEEFRRR